MEIIPNILAERYASSSMKSIWSVHEKILMERNFWIAVLKSQKELGLDVSQNEINDYESVKNKVDLDSIKKREVITKHDVKAKIEEFNSLAGHQHIHKGMTSRDLTENVEQIQIYKSLQLTLKKSVAAMVILSKKAEQYKNVLISGKSHNVAAQPTTLGKRFAMYGEELLLVVRNFEQLVERYPIRGIKGAVGTQIDQLTLFGDDVTKVSLLEDNIIKHLGFNNSFKIVGQVYPRSLDFEVISLLNQLTCAPVSFAKTLRIMAGHELASEGFGEGQVGSSAMPHKMNARSCERICGFQQVLKGYLTMISNVAGDQWNEGDVSCSVVRRVAIPDSFFVIDGLLETFITVLNQMEVYPAAIEKENGRYLPFLVTTTILMKAVKNGAGREAAHDAIKEHAISVAKDIRLGEINENDLISRLAEDDRVNLDRKILDEILGDYNRLTGNASNQVDLFLSEVNSWIKRYPDSLDFKTENIL